MPRTWRGLWGLQTKGNDVTGLLEQAHSGYCVENALGGIEGSSWEIIAGVQVGDDRGTATQVSSGDLILAICSRGRIKNVI